MITVCRIVKTRYADTAFDGEGARRTGGRWNSPGLPVIYTSATIALAVLEMLVHLGDRGILATYSVIGASFDEKHVEDLRELPADWRSYPAPPGLQMIGDEWLVSRRSLALRVPSAVVERESNYLINPEHEAFREIAIGAPERFNFDPRLN